MKTPLKHGSCQVVVGLIVLLCTGCTEALGQSDKGGSATQSPSTKDSGVKERSAASEEKELAELARKFIEAKPIARYEEALFNIRSVKLNIILNRETEAFIARETVRLVFTETLNSAGVKINDESPYTLSVVLEGLMEGDLLAYFCNVELNQFAIIPREGVFKIVTVTPWSTMMHATASRKLAPEFVLRTVKERAKKFADASVASGH